MIGVHHLVYLEQKSRRERKVGSSASKPRAPPSFANPNRCTIQKSIVVEEFR